MADEQVQTEVQAETPVADVTTKIESPAEQVADTAEKPDAEVAALEGEAETKDEPKRPSGLTRLKRNLALVQSEMDAVARERDELRRRVESASGNPQGKPGVDRPPTEADFPNDYLGYEAARTEWNVAQAVRREIGRAQDSGRQAQIREAQNERIEAYEENAKEVRDRIPDFDKVISTAQSVKVSPALADEILSSEKSALLQYHLATRPEKVNELNGLSGRELAREIGRLEARWHLPTAKKATEANAPPSQVRGAAAPPVDPQTGPDDMNAYVAWRKKQMAKAS